MKMTPGRFSEIYEAYRRFVTARAFYMTGDYYLAQDVCQEVFIRLYGCHKELDERGLKRWLLVVTTNVVNDYFRKYCSHYETERVPTGESGTRRGGKAPAYPYQGGQISMCRRMLSALYMKNVNWFEVFIQVECLGFSRKEVARRMGVSLSTIDRCIRKSRGWLGDNFGDEYMDVSRGAP